MDFRSWIYQIKSYSIKIKIDTKESYPDLPKLYHVIYNFLRVSLNLINHALFY
jgi:hypothetical protein